MARESTLAAAAHLLCGVAAGKLPPVCRINSTPCALRRSTHQAPRVALALSGLALGLASPGNAAADPGFGLGPVFAFSTNDTFSVGWELSALGSNPVYPRAALGGSYAWSAQADDPAHFHYLALEPWLYVGATLGVAMADVLEPRVVYGLWEGVGVSLDSDVLNSDERQWVFSIALGWRGVGGTHQLYLTPKLFRMNGWRLNS